MKRTLSIFAAAFIAVSLLAQSIDLPAPQKTGGMPLMDALAKRSTARAFDSKDLSPRQLSGLLWACLLYTSQWSETLNESSRLKEAQEALAHKLISNQ